ncbi:carbohydrate-binding protein [Saccharothrix violaceirubra]|uniref:Streptogrisin C n=1 Tax=Saccharothrix violaceirubra TaxID=413306 RepID=A0A7W7WZA1_9PSEU|nr:streptogrisin C [Saccharothrix violaceirubra]
MAVALTSSATAGPPTQPADSAMIAAMARDFGITTDQARDRLVREDAASRTEGDLKAKLGPAYAGAWLNGDASQLTVAATSDSQIQTIRNAGATPKLVKNNLGTLDALKTKLDNNARKVTKAVPGWYVDVQNNTVVVLTRDTAGAKQFVKSAGVNEADVRFEQSVEDPKPYIDVVGGNAYYIGSGSRCSVGFSVTNGGFVTAGHCGTQGASTTQPSGSFAGSSFPGNDYAWVRVSAGNTMKPEVNRYPGTVQVNGSTEAAVGASVCRSGSTTGWHCGTIQQKNASVSYQEGTVTGLTRTNACAEPGDSGGSWLAGDQAQGVTSGGSGTCSGGTPVMYFQPVNEILQAYGLTLMTSGGGGTTTTNPTGPTGPTGPTNPGNTTWKQGTAYAAGATVTYNGANYRCLQGHTAQPGWEPPSVPALWQRV